MKPPYGSGVARERNAATVRDVQKGGDMSLPYEEVADGLAVCVDFRVPERAALEQFFLSARPSRLASNPTVSTEMQRTLLGVEGEPRDPETLVNLLSVHQLRAETREWFVSHPHDPVVAAAFLEHQQPSEDEITRLLEHGLSEPVATCLASDPARFGLRQRRDLDEILGHASPRTKIMWLERATTQWAQARLRTGWLAGLDDYESNAVELNSLVEHRRDLYEDLVVVPSVALRRALANSRHLIQVNQQFAVIEPLTAALSDGLVDDALLDEFARELLTLVNNPRCHPEVRSAIVACIGDPAARANCAEPGIIQAVVNACDRRRHDYNHDDAVTEEYANVPAGPVLDWLVKRTASLRSANARCYYDAVELLCNPNISDTQHRALVKMCGTVDAQTQKRCAERLAKLGELTVAEPDSEEPPADPLAREYDSPALYSVRQLCRSLTHERAQRTFASPEYVSSGRRCANWVVEHLGVDPVVYPTFFALAEDWTLTVGELCETVTTLMMVPA